MATPKVAAFTVIFHIEDDHMPVVLKLYERVIIGRQAPNMQEKLDVDLNNYHAAEHGISRIHATLEHTEQGILLTDLGSRNGTFHNGDKLSPFDPQILHDGDQVRLGKLMLRVEIQAGIHHDNRILVSRVKSQTGKLEETMVFQRV